MKKTIIVWSVVAGVILLLVLPKIDFKGGKKGKDAQTGGGMKAGGKVPVEVFMVKSGQLDNKLVVTGSVLPNESLEVKSEESGKVTHINFREGSPVKKGDVLIQLDDDEIRAQLEKQRFNRKLNQDIEARQRKLLEKEAISQEEYDNALNKLNTGESDIRLLEAQLRKTQIVAPFHGVIGLRHISEGAFVTPSTTIAILYNLSRVKIEFAVPGKYSAQVSPGKKINFTIENDSNEFVGTVYAIEPQIDASTRTLKIRALADNPKGKLIPGQFVKVELILESFEHAVLIPSESVVPDLSGHKVYVLKGGKVKESKVEIGIRTGQDVEIVSGLQLGDTLITTGILQVKPGMGIDITKVN